MDSLHVLTPGFQCNRATVGLERLYPRSKGCYMFSCTLISCCNRSAVNSVQSIALILLDLAKPSDRQLETYPVYFLSPRTDLLNCADYPPIYNFGSLGLPSTLTTEELETEA